MIFFHVVIYTLLGNFSEEKTKFFCRLVVVIKLRTQNYFHLYRMEQFEIRFYLA